MNNFKKITLGILGATILSLGLYACSNDNEATTQQTETLQSTMSKTLTDNDFYYPKNEDFVIKSENHIIEVSDVYSRAKSLKRKIVIKDIQGNTKFNPFYIKFDYEGDIDMYEALTKFPERVNGKFQIAYGNEILSVRPVVEGSFADNTVFVNPPTKDPSVPCNVTTVHDCVSYKIEDMNWADLGLCFAGAPACYGGLWASCAEDVCARGIRYENPIK